MSIYFANEGVTRRPPNTDLLSYTALHPREPRTITLPKTFLRESVPYTEVEAGTLLEEPTTFADGRPLKYPPQEESPEPYIESYSLDLHRPVSRPLPDSRKVYTGPVFLQGVEPTCSAWSVIHSSYAVGSKPSPQFAATLLNAALPQSEYVKQKGLNIFAIGAAIEGEDDAPITYTVPFLQSHDGRYSSDDISRFIKATVDGGSALIAVVDLMQSAQGRVTSIDLSTKGKKKPIEEGDFELSLAAHAVSIVGYNVTDGVMNLQIVDSNAGEKAVSVKALTEQMNQHNQLSPPIAVVSPKVY